MSKADFVPNGNESPTPHFMVEDMVVTPTVLRERLLEIGVCAVYIAQGNFMRDFYDLMHEPGLYTKYMHHRRRLLHQDALDQARFEARESAAHPFSF